MQKVVVGHDIDFGESELSIVRGALQPVPSQVITLPSFPTALQKLVVGHETDMRSAATKEVPSILVGELQPVPSQVRALPLKSTAIQKLDDTHEIEARSFEPSTLVELDHVGPAFDTVTENDLVEVCTGEAESDTWMVKLVVPEIVGVPEIEPVDVPKLSPAGSEPELRLQLYGELPPTTDTDAE